MHPTHSETGNQRRYLIPIGIGLLGVLTAAPGMHVFEQFLSPTPAIVISHGIAIVLLGVAVMQWRARRRTTL